MSSYTSGNDSNQLYSKALENDCKPTISYYHTEMTAGRTRYALIAITIGSVKVIFSGRNIVCDASWENVMSACSIWP